ncbi:cytochrome P450 [Suillus discolor]|uniref:Cytochrome P450 n=1 Tax=Suillus discolor TaxID=1912936 RepID=A0A9P7FGC9_9AGAM|nr:cytochrome P450 [Suillus discolor]KAG2116998.1 cytochrome P450 [Suillus discolor]
MIDLIPSVDSLAVLAVLYVFFVVITVRRFIGNRQHKPLLPPGPVPLPILGNVLSIDTKQPWLTYTEWHATYGDLFFVRILDQKVVVINSQRVARALLHNRSRIYSDRPYLATVEPFGWMFNFLFAGYNDAWRLSRRLFHQTFHAESALKFRPMQIRRAHEMIVNLISDSRHYDSHFATFSSSVVISAVYGYESSAQDDPLVGLFAHSMQLGIPWLTPERAIMIKTFPFLLKLPDWCPGSSIKCDARISTNSINEMVDVPFQYVQRRMADNSLLDTPSMVAENLQRVEKQDKAFKSMFETALKNTAATAVGGGYETTTGMLMVFVLAMVLYPDVQKRAQAEIDSVIGRDRLPAFEDKKSLPYVDAVVRETYQWMPIAPLDYPIGIPHATSSEDTYDGYYIPKDDQWAKCRTSGAIVMCNLWAISHDEKRYPDACHFIPERFIDINGALTDDDPVQYIFGLGRRICPGRYIADASMWSAIVTMLSTVDISSAKDDQGKAVDFTPKFATGIT